jgi:hypothetical protein
MDLILIGHMRKKKNILPTQKCGSKPLNTKWINLSLIAIENGVECLLK